MPKPFGTEHIIFFLVFIGVAIGVGLLHNSYIKTAKQKELTVKLVAVFLLIAALTNRISQCVYKNNFLKLLPETYCGVTSIALSLCVLLIPNRNHEIFHFLVYIAFFGSLCNNFYPDYIGQAASVFYLPTITGLLHHTVSIYLIMIMFMNGDFVPSIKKWWCLPIGFCVFIVYGLFCKQTLNIPNPMNITNPILPNTILKWHMIGITYMFFELAFVVPYEIVKRSSIKRHYNKASNQ